MTAMELDACRAELARTILTTEDYDLLDKIKRLVKRESKKRYAVAEDSDEGMAKEEIMADFADACHELKLRKEGKITFKTLGEAINEL